jgi:hypothetical protein
MRKKDIIYSYGACNRRKLATAECVTAGTSATTWIPATSTRLATTGRPATEGKPAI